MTLITRDVETPYSGMLPGHVAGFYTRAECHLDLDRLAVFAGRALLYFLNASTPQPRHHPITTHHHFSAHLRVAALPNPPGVRLIHAEATGVDRSAKVVHLRGRPDIPYDVLSINIGSAPQVADRPQDFAVLSSPGGGGAAVRPAVVPVKPIDGFGRRWDELLARVAALDLAALAARPLRVCVVGGGAGGIELALSMHHRLKQELDRRGAADPSKLVAMAVVTRSKQVLPTHPKPVSDRSFQTRWAACRYRYPTQNNHRRI